MRPRRYTKAEREKRGVSKAGAAAVEFALVATIFFILFFGIIEFSRLMLMYHHVGNAAREGTRYAIVHGSASGSPVNNDNVVNYVRSISPIDPNNVNVSTTWPDGNNNPKSRVRVLVTYDFRFSLPVWFGINIPLASTSEMVISY